MATWVRNGTGTAPSVEDGDLTGTYELDNGTAPSDFDPDAVNSVRIQWTIAITAGTLVDDSWSGIPSTHNVALTLNGNGTQLSEHFAQNGNVIDSGTSSMSSDSTDSSIPTGHTVAEWEGAEVNPANTNWATHTQDMKADSVTIEVTVLTVTIDYTPAVAESPAPFPRRQLTTVRM